MTNARSRKKKRKRKEKKRAERGEVKIKKVEVNTIPPDKKWSGYQDDGQERGPSPLAGVIGDLKLRDELLGR